MPVTTAPARGPPIAPSTVPIPAPRPARAATAACLAVAAALLAACASPEPLERYEPSGGPTSGESVRGLTYWGEGEESLKLDACPAAGTAAATGAGGSPAPGPEGSSAPAGSEGVPAMIIVHGGGFTSGDRSDPGVANLCAEVAGSGIAAFAISYRLAPEHRYPAQLDDLRHAVEWVREPEQVQRFTLDPARVGVIGSSAGAILAQQLATSGEGPLDQGDRVRAVVSLSGVSEMGPRGARLGEPSPQAADIVLGYLGCTEITSCPPAAQASPTRDVDPSDPPMLLVNGSDELVPAEQAEAMGAALARAGVDHEVVIVQGSRHGLALLEPTVRSEIASFVEENL